MFTESSKKSLMSLLFKDPEKNSRRIPGALKPAQYKQKDHYFWNHVTENIVKLKLNVYLKWSVQMLGG